MPLPPVSPGDSIIVPQITETVTTPDLKERADSLNRSLRILAIEERLLDSELWGGAPRSGVLPRKDYLEARINLLRDMENSLQMRLRLKLADLDTSISRVESEIEADRESEISSLEAYLQMFPRSTSVADAKFILGQLYYDRERKRYTDAMLRYTSEFQRYRLGLLPVAPTPPSLDESVSVPMYNSVVELGTNPELMPYSYYSLGKYHLEEARDYRARSDEFRLLRRREESLHFQQLSDIQTDSAKGFFARLVVEFPEDSVNVPEAYYVLASHYNMLGGFTNRDTAGVYCGAIVRNYWYSPRYQNAMIMMGQISYFNGVGTRDRNGRNQHFSNALAYMGWLAREVDAFSESQIPGVSPDPPRMMDVTRRDYAVQFMTQIITRQSPLPGMEPPPPVETAVRLVSAAGNPPFGADLLRQVGDKKNSDYNTSAERKDLVAALTAYDSLLSRYPTYKDGPQIQQVVINGATYLSEDPAERFRIFIRQKILFFERFNRNSAWARQSDASPEVMKAADDSSAAYLETGARWLYGTARAANDRDGIRKSLDYFVRYFQTYPERPQAYELNWSLATELRELGDYERAYEEFMRVSNAKPGAYREDAALEAVAAAQQLIDVERGGAAPGTETPPTPETPAPQQQRRGGR
jgi:tetratricopeptide (TPR) repeat protein